MSFRYHESTLQEVLDAFDLDPSSGDLTLKAPAADLETTVRQRLDIIGILYISYISQ